MHRASPSPSARQRKPLSFGNEVWQRILKLSLPYPYFSLPHQRKPVLSVKIFRVWLKEKYYRLNIAVRVCRFYFIKRNVGGLNNRSNSFKTLSSLSLSLFFFAASRKTRFVCKDLPCTVKREILSIKYRRARLQILFH